MKQSDPENIRVEAASMLVASAEGPDQLGIVRFGNEASWLRTPAPLNGKSGLIQTLSSIQSADQHTDFAAPLRTISDYGDAHIDLLRNYDVSVVLMTDGAPDPPPGYIGGADQNRRDSVQLATNLAKKGVRIFTIGLGSGVRSDFLQDLAVKTGGSYAPARNSNELGDAFLKAVTKIFSLPAYQEVRGPAPVHLQIGRSATLVRAYLFRRNPSTTLSDGKPSFSSEHIAIYELPKQSQTALQITGPTDGADAIVCVREPLSFAEVNPLPPSLLVDSRQSIALKLQADGHPIWDRLFMKDATVALQMHSAAQPGITQPLYPDPAKQSFAGIVPTNIPGDFEERIRLDSPYASVDYFLGKQSIAESAIKIPIQANLVFPSFAPLYAARLFGTKLSVRNVMPSGTAHLVFLTNGAIAVAPAELDLAPGEQRSISLYAARKIARKDLPQFYSVTWTDDEQSQGRQGVISLHVSAQTPAGFAGAHWLALTAIILAVLLLTKLGSKPRIQGILVIDQPGSAKRQIMLHRLKTKELIVSESSTEESLQSNPVRVRTGADRDLFTLRMKKIRGAWSPSMERHVPIEGPVFLKHGSIMLVKDRDLSFTFYQGK